jgi:protein-S-isoprenylcysteine O-methyltransferase Ste14
MPASVALVTLQMIALAALAWPWDATHWNAVGWPLVVAAAAVGAWTLAHNRPGNFSVMPEPRATARLVTTGPYAYVRHPMYTAVMLASLALAAGWNTPLHWIALVALVVVLWVKAAREERLLAARFPGYAAYAARTPRFLPSLPQRGAR